MSETLNATPPSTSEELDQRPISIVKATINLGATRPTLPAEVSQTLSDAAGGTLPLMRALMTVVATEADRFNQPESTVNLPDVGSVHVVFEKKRGELVMGVVAPDEVSAWRAGRYEVIGALPLDAKQLWGVPTEADVVARSFGELIDLVAFRSGDVLGLISRPLVAALNLASVNLAQELSVGHTALLRGAAEGPGGEQVARFLVGAVEVELTRALMPSGGRHVVVLLAVRAREREQRAGQKALKRVRASLARLGEVIQ